ncbi:hypothetical protein JOE58_003349 [Curtobacterium luteum]|uniref:Uncharacterized protein n=1 Tax=Curtobacterium luteum TaxID=33881 RepID=A0A8H9G990_9MICO|nr:hypothetical protein [Curtobacterium luteum]MBM7804098.1 hypothetical protein [Curtobacterium luteum]NUU50985.1 hypothetical protein [Curtobacterium luteum]GGK97713.1 hypothetical protein GCM10009769_14820 [Curtobacterium luteum]
MVLHRARPSAGRTAVAVAVLATAMTAVLGLVVVAAGPATATPATWIPDRVTTDAPGAATSFAAPNDVRYTTSGALLLADFAANGVLRRDPDGTWSIVAPLGTDDRSMWNPSALTEAADGHLLVAEAGRRTVAELDGHDVLRRFPAPSRRAVSELATTGDVLFAAVPGSGALWTTGTGADAGTWTAVDGPWTDPAGVAVSSDGSTLTVADQATDTVWQEDLATGAVTSLGSPGDDPGTVRLRGVAVLDDGSVAVVDNGGGRVFVRQDGVWTVAFSGAPDGSSLANPTAVAAGPEGRLAVADYNRQRVVEAARVGGGAVTSPTAAPTGAPTATGTETPSPTPTDVATPTDVPTPTPEPVPVTPTPEPVPVTPTPTATSSPAPLPVPVTPTPEPVPVTPTPEPVPVTPAPTATSSPAPLPAPTPAPTPTPTATSSPAPLPATPSPGTPTGPRDPAARPPALHGGTDAAPGGHGDASSGAVAALPSTPGDHGDAAARDASHRAVLAATGAGPLALTALGAVAAVLIGIALHLHRRNRSVHESRGHERPGRRP